MKPVQPCLPRMSPLRPRKAKREEPELMEQTALFRWLGLQSPRYPMFRWIHSSANGAFMHPATARKMVAAGMTAGVWDIFIPFASLHSPGGGREGISRGAYIEMKIAPNKLTAAQVKFRNEVIIPGNYAFHVAFSWIEAARFILEYFGIADKRLWDELRMSTPGVAAPTKKVGKI